MAKKLVVLLGSTGVGKTDLSVSLAEHWKTSIVSADSRQLYNGLIIGTAAPTEKQLTKVPHYLVGTLDIQDYYSASEFEQEALRIIENLHQTDDIVIVSGGSMMYLDALCKGIDEIPSIDESLRQLVYERYEKEGLDSIRAELKILDPVFYDQVDLKNHKRVIHALEVCLMTGQPYSSFRKNTIKQRPFEIVKIGLMRDRQELYDRINQRVDFMIQEGLIDEVKRYYPYRHLNSLNTVGYKEIFKYLAGEWDREFAIEKIKQNSRIYSRKQMTWYKRDSEIYWINLSEVTLEQAKQMIIERASN